MPLSEEQRRLQSERIRRQKPWLKATGPRTREGKAKSARNAFKGGERQLLRDLSRALSSFGTKQGTATNRNKSNTSTNTVATSSTTGSKQFDR